MRAAMIGCGELRRILSTPGWVVNEAEQLSRPLQSLEVPGLADNNIKAVVMFYTAYVASASACMQGMVSVAAGLVRHAAGRLECGAIGDKLPDGLTVDVLDLLADCYETGANTLVLYRQHALAPSATKMETL